MVLYYTWAERRYVATEVIANCSILFYVAIFHMHESKIHVTVLADQVAILL